jgi:hypothetical protein
MTNSKISYGVTEFEKSISIKKRSYNYGTFYKGEDKKWHYGVRQMGVTPGKTFPFCEDHIRSVRGNYETLITGYDIPHVRTEGEIFSKLQELNK